MINDRAVSLGWTCYKRFHDVFFLRACLIRTLWRVPLVAYVQQKFGTQWRPRVRSKVINGGGFK